MTLVLDFTDSANIEVMTNISTIYYIDTMLVLCQRLWGWMTKLQILTLRKKKLSSWSSQMTKVIHYDFLIVAEAMTSAFSVIEKNQSWNLMPSLVTELALCFDMLQRELNLHCIELEYEKSQ